VKTEQSQPSSLQQPPNELQNQTSLDATSGFAGSKNETAYDEAMDYNNNQGFEERGWDGGNQSSHQDGGSQNDNHQIGIKEDG